MHVYLYVSSAECRSTGLFKVKAVNEIELQCENHFLKIKIIYRAACLG